MDVKDGVQDMIEKLRIEEEILKEIFQEIRKGRVIKFEEQGRDLEILKLIREAVSIERAMHQDLLKGGLINGENLKIFEEIVDNIKGKEEASLRLIDHLHRLENKEKDEIKHCSKIVEKIKNLNLKVKEYQDKNKQTQAVRQARVEEVKKAA